MHIISYLTALGLKYSLIIHRIKVVLIKWLVVSSLFYERLTFEQER